MKRYTIPIAVFLALLLVFSSAHARVEWKTINSFKDKGAALDIATSLDGNWIYILSSGGKIKIYAPDGTLNDTIDVDPAMDRIDTSGLSIANIPDKLVVSSSKTGAVQEILLEFVVDINAEGSPFKGKADAPVVLAVYSDFQ